MNTKRDAYSELELFGLKPEETKIYIELLKAPATHAALSQATSVNRTKVYRIVQDLERRGLIARQTDDRGTFLTACDPSVLKSAIITQEQKTMEQRSALQSLLPALYALQSQGGNLFTTRTYDGLEGLKQMCWHELKAKGELLLLGGGFIEEIIPNHYWAEKHRALSVEAAYRVYEIISEATEDAMTFTDNELYMRRFEYRVLPTKILHSENQIVIYNDSVGIYHWREDQKCGVEIINGSYAEMMRQIFWHYWHIARVPKSS